MPKSKDLSKHLYNKGEQNKTKTGTSTCILSVKLETEANNEKGTQGKSHACRKDTRPVSRGIFFILCAFSFLKHNNGYHFHGATRIANNSRFNHLVRWTILRSSRGPSYQRKSSNARNCLFIACPSIVCQLSVNCCSLAVHGLLTAKRGSR